MLLFCQILIKLDNSNCKLTRYFINIILHSIHKPQISILKSPLELCSLATGGTQETSNLKPQTSNLLRISAKHGTNIDALEQAIYQAANIPTISDSDIIISNARHYNALLSAHHNISRVLEGMGGIMTNGEWSMIHESTSGDLLSEDLKLVLDDLADITGQGRIVTNEILSNIFTHFCVGK